MNKLLLLALFSACLIVIASGLQKPEEDSIQETDASNARETRASDLRKKSGKNKKVFKKTRQNKSKSKKVKNSSWQEKPVCSNPEQTAGSWWWKLFQPEMQW